MDHAIMRHCVFIDECGYNIWTARNHGRARQGERAYIEDITCPRVDMNFIFEWSTRYLTRSLRSLVRYQVEHEKIKFISISGHVIFCLLYKHTYDDVIDYFPKISDHFPEISEDLPKFVRRPAGTFPNILRTFPEDYRKFPNISEDCRRLLRKNR